MTTYILHGGETSAKSSNNDAFFAEFTSNTDKDHVRILICTWARVEEEWDKIFARDTQKILNQTQKQVDFHLVKNVKDLDEKISDYDVLYFAAGNQKPSEKYYPIVDVKKLETQLDNKVCIGSSMGAFFIAQNYILSMDDQREDVVYPGFGLLPINCLCHWNVEEKKQMKINLLQKHSPNLPILTLDEHKYTKIIY